MKNSSCISYIIRFLLNGEDEALVSQVGYTHDPKKFTDYKVVIIPSPFFNDEVYLTEASLPTLPLNEIEQTPLLFGEPRIERQADTLIVYADIIASSYFLLSRYEEVMKREIRDEYGRFPGKESLPCRAGFIHRPIVEEYGCLLRGWLRQVGVPITEPSVGIRKVWLTHDVDAPFFCRSFRNFVREVVRGNGVFQTFKRLFRPVGSDPYYMFPWLLDRGNLLQKAIGMKRCESVFFLKGGGKSVEDKPYYSLSSADIQKLLEQLKASGATIGLHSSFDAGKVPSLIVSEHEKVEKAVGKPIVYNRHHCLSSREPEDMDWLETYGLTADFTMGYADVAGFRLGTSRRVQWMNPLTGVLSSLLLYPLTIMDVTLSEAKYMGLDYDMALDYCRLLISQVAKVNGELVLLWHNNSVSELNTVNWQRKLYEQLTEELKLA